VPPSDALGLGLVTATHLMPPAGLPARRELCPPRRRQDFRRTANSAILRAMRSHDDILRRKRDGITLTNEEMKTFVAGMADGAVSEAAQAVFANNIWYRGLTLTECVAMSRSLAKSGVVIDWRSQLPDDRPVLDHYTTGGTGDKTSLILAPLLAACGARAPFTASTRGGAGGRVLRALGTIPGYRLQPDLRSFIRVVREAGCTLTWPPPELAPAEQRFARLRFETASADCPDLIAATVVAMKLAVNPDALVVDVKYGKGAISKDRFEAFGLAEGVTAVAGHTGLRSVALLTDVTAVTGRAIGPALELAEVIRILRGDGCEPRLREVVTRLAGELLVLGGLASDLFTARRRAEETLERGRALEAFGRMVSLLGGPAIMVEKPEQMLPRAPVVRPLHAPREGLVIKINDQKLNSIARGLGACATPSVSADVATAAGLSHIAGVGDRADPRGVPLAVVHAASDEDAEAAVRALRPVFSIGDSLPACEMVVAQRVPWNAPGQAD